jgi:hypothetical protein
MLHAGRTRANAIAEYPLRTYTPTRSQGAFAATLRLNKIFAGDSGNTITHSKKMRGQQQKQWGRRAGEGHQCGAAPGWNCSSALASHRAGIRTTSGFLSASAVAKLGPRDEDVIQ